MQMTRKFTVIIERDEAGFLVADVPELEGCHTQGKTLDELIKNTREVIGLCLEEKCVLPGSLIHSSILKRV